MMRLETAIVYGVIFGVAVAFLAVYCYWSYLKAKKVKARIAAEYGREPAWALDERDYNSMKRFFHQKPLEEPEFDDITWNDLNMDAVFKRVRNTQSSVGDEYCYRFFRRQRNDDPEYFEQAVRAVHREGEKRNRLQYAFYKIGRKTNNRLVDLILDPGKFPKIPFIAVILVTLLGIGSLVWVGIDIDYGISAVTLSFCAALILYSFIIRKIAPELVTLTIFVQLVRAAQLTVKLDIPELHRETEALKKSLKVFKNINSLVETIVQAASGAGRGMLVILVSYFGLYAFVYKAMVRLFTKHREQVLELYEAVGYIELCISIASYRESLDFYCRPEFCEDGKIEFQEIIHPLLKRPVANSHEMGDKIMITGSNASGKSTFARTLAVNAVLGQLFNTCLAKRYVFRPCTVFTSMNLKDDITTGDSFYVAEVKSLKRLMSEAAGPGYAMLFLDEIFKGANMVERIAAASVILKRLALCDCFVCLCTHDLELSRIMAGRYENYHFQEQITDDDIFFDYKLREGVTTGSNAIKLLAYCGYEPDIVSQAETLAGRFGQSGEWDAL